MICYFRKSLKLSVKIEIEQQDQKAISFEEIMQKAVNAKSKASLRSSIIVHNSDIYYPRGHCHSNSTTSKVQTQKTIANDSHPEESKVKEIKSTFS